MHTLVKYHHPFLLRFDQKSRSEAQKKLLQELKIESQTEDMRAVQSLMNDMTQYFITIIYALTLLLQIALLIKVCPDEINNLHTAFYSYNGLPWVCIRLSR